MLHGKLPIVFLMIVLLLLFLCACRSAPAQPQAEPATTAATTAEATTAPTTTEPTTTEPTATAPTETAAFSVGDVAMTATPNSSCFSKIGYSEPFETLVVTFRDSGKTYCYTNFTASDWAAFRKADSLGRYFNVHIKGKYPCEKV